MLAPISYVPSPRTDPLQTRRPCSGTMAHGVLVPTLHAYLARHRPHAVHTLDLGPLVSSNYIWEITPIPATANEPVRVVIDTSDRAQYLAVHVVYRAGYHPTAGGALTIGCRLDTLAGAAVDAGFVWGSAASGPLPPTGEWQAFNAGYTWTYRESIVSTGDTPPAVVGVTPRPLAVGASAGQALQVVVTGSYVGAGAIVTAAEVLSVAVWEIADPEVTP